MLINKTRNDIIQIGCGQSSIPFIYDAISGTSRKLYSADSNVSNFKPFSDDKNLKLLHVPATNDDTDVTGRVWVDFCKKNISSSNADLCVILASPWSTRTHTLEYFKNICKYVLVFDVDYFPCNNKWGTILSSSSAGTSIKYEMTFEDIAQNWYVHYPSWEYFVMPTGPPTLLCSNLVEEDEFYKITNELG